MHYVYILYSQKRSKYYVGMTGNLKKRLIEHNSAKSGFTSLGQPWTLVYSESYESKTEALKREGFLKRMKSATFLKELINTEKITTDA